MPENGKVLKILCLFNNSLRIGLYLHFSSQKNKKIPVIDFLSNSVSEFEENCISVLVKSNAIFNGFGSSSDSMFNGLQRTWWEVFQDVMGVIES